MSKTAFPITDAPVTITIYSNIPFDNTYKNHSIISQLFKYGNNYIFSGLQGNPCEMFIDRLVDPSSPRPMRHYYERWTLTGEYNFNFTNGLIGSVTLELQPVQTNANYMKVVCGNDVYYYFITSIVQSNFDTYNLSLECDVLMTYQDEFLEGMKDIPVFTTRKHSHCFDSSGLVPYGCDLKTGDSSFAGIKPNIISHSYNMSFKDEKWRNLTDIVWLYVCVDTQEYEVEREFSRYKYYICYKHKNVSHPLSIACIPISRSKKDVIINCGQDNLLRTNAQSIQTIMNKLVGSGDVHACKLSPYPPFSLENVTISSTLIDITMSIPESIVTEKSVYVDNNANTLYVVDTNKSEVTFYKTGTNHNWFFITDEKQSTYAMSDLLVGLKRLSPLTIMDTRRKDTKLLFTPFRKYTISAPYGSCEIFPEIYYSSHIISGDTLSFSTITTSYIGDNTMYTYLSEVKDYLNNNLVVDYNKENIGLSSSINYIVPAGENALDVFNSTQANAFYQSKTASGITSGITMAGGIGMIVGGAVMTATGYGSGAGIGMIGAGATALASGTASMVNTFKSANAKIEDLKNTPDSFNVAGSSYVCDFSRAGTCYPYLTIYECEGAIEERANDYFYNYGYEVARDCYFNTQLEVSNHVNNFIDNNLFTRTIFNYIQINEDITNKINADIPLIAKQKLSSIFNNGITIWNFFGFPKLWNTSSYTSTYNYDKWFMKHTYDNTEYTQ